METIHLDKKYYNKMKFIMNAIENGWTVRKMDDNYIFTQKHENRREVFNDDYLERFIEENLGINLGNN
jgi:hypothetical protein